MLTARGQWAASPGGGTESCSIWHGDGTGQGQDGALSAGGQYLLDDVAMAVAGSQVQGGVVATVHDVDARSPHDEHVDHTGAALTAGPVEGTEAVVIPGDGEDGCAAAAPGRAARVGPGAAAVLPRGGRIALRAGHGVMGTHQRLPALPHPRECPRGPGRVPSSPGLSQSRWQEPDPSPSPVPGQVREEEARQALKGEEGLAAPPCPPGSGSLHGRAPPHHPKQTCGAGTPRRGRGKAPHPQRWPEEGSLVQGHRAVLAHGCRDPRERVGSTSDPRELLEQGRCCGQLGSGAGRGSAGNQHPAVPSPPARPTASSGAARRGAGDSGRQSRWPRWGPGGSPSPERPSRRLEDAQPHASAML